MHRKHIWFLSPRDTPLPQLSAPGHLAPAGPCTTTAARRTRQRCAAFASVMLGVNARGKHLVAIMLRF